MLDSGLGRLQARKLNTSKKTASEETPRQSAGPRMSTDRPTSGQLVVRPPLRRAFVGPMLGTGGPGGGYIHGRRRGGAAAAAAWMIVNPRRGPGRGPGPRCVGRLGLGSTPSCAMLHVQQMPAAPAREPRRAPTPIRRSTGRSMSDLEDARCGLARRRRRGGVSLGGGGHFTGSSVAAPQVAFLYY